MRRRLGSWLRRTARHQTVPAKISPLRRAGASRATAEIALAAFGRSWRHAAAICNTACLGLPEAGAFTWLLSTLGRADELRSRCPVKNPLRSFFDIADECRQHAPFE